MLARTPSIKTGLKFRRHAPSSTTDWTFRSGIPRRNAPNEIICVGRAAPEKGIKEAALAMAAVLGAENGWRGRLILAEPNRFPEYLDEVLAAIRPRCTTCHDRIQPTVFDRATTLSGRSHRDHSVEMGRAVWTNRARGPRSRLCGYQRDQRRPARNQRQQCLDATSRLRRGRRRGSAQNFDGRRRPAPVPCTKRPGALQEAILAGECLGVGR